MNKKAYITPALEEVKLNSVQPLLTASGGESTTIIPSDEPGGVAPRDDD